MYRIGRVWRFPRIWGKRWRKSYVEKKNRKILFEIIGSLFACKTTHLVKHTFKAQILFECDGTTFEVIFKKQADKLLYVHIHCCAL